MWYKIDEEGQKLLIKYERAGQAEFKSMLSEAEDSGSVKVKGSLDDGSEFAGEDTIRIISKAAKK